MLPSIFSSDVVLQLKARFEKLMPQSQPQWGRMTAPQMLAHCNVTYEMIYDNIHPKPNFFLGLILKSIVKKAVVNEAPYARNLKTGPQFLVSADKDFNREKERLFQYMDRTQSLGEAHFHMKESVSFGPLTVTEWNNMMYKHLDHHFTQFGV